MTNSRQTVGGHLTGAANHNHPCASNVHLPPGIHFDPGASSQDQEIKKVFQKLSRAWQYSLDCQRSQWDFAVELLNLDHDGVSHETLRWMIGKGLIEHGVETRDHQGIGRLFESPGGFSFSGRSCFVVTANGLAWQTGHGCGMGPNSNGAAPEPSLLTLTPRWDDQRHELWLSSVLVKRFKSKAVNQESVLAAFQEEGWPSRIDDPLSPIADGDPKRRLSDAIKCLNRKQATSLIRFSGDGTGEGVLWDIIDSPVLIDGDNPEGPPPGNKGNIA